MQNVGIYTRLPLHLLQSIRVIHALAESKYQVAISPEHEDKFARLVEVFQLSYRTDLPNCHLVEGIELSHAKPQVLIGSIQRPLVFPHAILDKCQGMWSAERPIRYSFAGLVTGERHATLQGWVAKNFDGRVLPLVAKPTLLMRVLRKLRKKLVTKVAIGDLLLWSSTRGRVFPYKAWDEDYFRLLSDSLFVLCPSGDFTWTYRFFEAIMCGAIPIVEKPCAAYDGFHFYSMQQSASSYVYSEEIALENFRLCQERITVPCGELDAEITSLLQL